MATKGLQDGTVTTPIVPTPASRAGSTDSLKTRAMTKDPHITTRQRMAVFAVGLNCVARCGIFASQSVDFCRDKLKVYGVTAQQITTKMVNLSVLFSLWNWVYEPRKHNAMCGGLRVLSVTGNTGPSITVRIQASCPFPTRRAVKEFFSGNPHVCKDAANLFGVQVAYGKVFNSHIAFSLTESVRGWGQLGGRTSSWPVCILA